ncbi:hypothetical protein L7F22_003375 [Adiantum nelumboides]|nr:hypothetical protein [Adiantum nelumboides]
MEQRCVLVFGTTAPREPPVSVLEKVRLSWQSFPFDDQMASCRWMVSSASEQEKHMWLGGWLLQGVHAGVRIEKAGPVLSCRRDFQCGEGIKCVGLIEELAVFYSILSEVETAGIRFAGSIGGNYCLKGLCLEGVPRIQVSFGFIWYSGGAVKVKAAVL